MSIRLVDTETIDQNGHTIRTIILRLTQHCRRCNTIFRPKRKQVFCTLGCSQRARDEKKKLKKQPILFQLKHLDQQ